MTAWAALAAGSLLSAIWQGLVLTVLAALVLRAAPGISAAARSALWSAVFLLAVALHFIPASSAPAGHHASPSWSIALTGLWLLLSLYRAGQLAAGAWQLQALGRRATPVQAGIPAGPLRRAALLCTSSDVDRPSVIGFFRPRILIPESLYAGLTPAQLEPILLHETGHLRRGDDWTNLLQKLALVLFPLNPVLLWVERRLCRERELACDEHVLSATRAPKAYALCLTSLVEHAARHRALSLALGAWQRQSELAARVHRILHQPSQRLSRWQTGAISSGLLLTLFGAAHTLARSPQLLSFMPETPVLTAAVGGSVPVSTFRAGSLPTKAMLTRTSEPGPSTAAVIRPATLARKRRHALRPASKLLPVASAPALRAGSQPRLTVAFFPSLPCGPAECSSSPAFVPVVAYAVPTPNGWIFIQL